MLLKIQLFLLSLITVDASKQHDARPILIKLDTEQIIDTLTSKDTLRYIERLAQEFATKAAEHFIDQVRNKERELAKDYQQQAKKIRDRSIKNVLKENEAMALVDEPPPDGDNLELDFHELTDEEPPKTIPVIELKKVNGRYYYRRLGEI